MQQLPEPAWTHGRKAMQPSSDPARAQGWLHDQSLAHDRVKSHPENQQQAEKDRESLLYPHASEVVLVSLTE
jgi:hypothetical protein